MNKLTYGIMTTIAGIFTLSLAACSSAKTVPEANNTPPAATTIDSNHYADQPTIQKNTDRSNRLAGLGAGSSGRSR